MSSTLLIVDDEEEMCLSLSEILSSRGFTVLKTTEPLTVVGLLREHRIDLVLMDVRMPDIGGVSLLRTVREHCPELPIIMMSGYASTDNIVRSMKYGALNFYEKPLNIPALLEEVEEYLSRNPRPGKGAPEALVSRNPRMEEVFAVLRTAAPTEVPVIITGESGTGKEHIARAVHSHSRRAGGPYVKLNCAAIPDALLESELFGYEKGAFTDARQTRQGKFEAAQGGSIFLDEIGDMSLPTQAKLLRVLQEKEFEKLGSNQTVRADIRIIAATNKDIPALIARGEFREDLYYRISVITIGLPPLRERKEDLPLLCRRFLEEFNRSYGKAIAGLEPGVEEMFRRHDWPGNIRELKNVMERAVIFCREDRLQREDLPVQHRRPMPAGEEPAREKPLESIYEELSRRAIIEALRESGGSRSGAAERLGIHRKTLYNRMKKYGIP